MIETQCEQYKKYLIRLKADKVRYDDYLEADLGSGNRQSSLTMKDIFETEFEHGQQELAKDRFILTIRATGCLYTEEGLDPIPKESVASKVKIMGHRIVIEGDLVFNSDLGKLPDNLYIKGELNLSSANITHLPKKLAAHKLVINEGLKELPYDLTSLDEINIMLESDYNGNDDIPLLNQARKFRKQGVIQKIRVNDIEII